MSDTPGYPPPGPSSTPWSSGHEGPTVPQQPAWSPTPPPPPGAGGPTPPPPGAPGWSPGLTPPPPGGPPPTTVPPAPPGGKKGGSGLLALAIVVIVVAAIAVAVGGVMVVRNQQREDREQEQAEARERERTEARRDLAKFVVAGDGEQVVRLLARHDGLIDSDERLDPGGADAELDVNAAGFVAVQVTLESGTEYIARPPSGDAGLVLVTPDADAAVPVEGAFVAEASGRHTLVAATDEDTVTVGLDTVRTEAVELGEVTTYELEDPSEILDITFDVLAGEQYDWYPFEVDGLQGTVLDEEGAEVSTTENDDGSIRIVPEADAEYRLRVTNDSGEDAGEFDVDVYRVARYSVYYGEDGDDAFLESVTEPEEFEPQADSARNALLYCVFVRADVALEYEFAPTTTGSTWDLNVYVDEISGEPVDTLTDVETKVVSIDATDADRYFCYELLPTSDVSSAMVVTVAEV